MSYLDDLAGITPSQKAKKAEETKQAKISSGKSYLDTLAESSSEPQVITPSEPVDFKIPKIVDMPSFKNVQSLPKPAQKLSPSEQFKTPEYEQKIATSYDEAKDKWKYKSSLTNLELDILTKVRPESKSVSSTPIYTPTTPDYLKPRKLTESDLSIAKAYESAPDKLKYKQSLTNSEIVSLLKTHPESEQIVSKSIYTPEPAKIDRDLLSYVPDTKLEQKGVSYTDQEARLKKAEGSVLGTMGAKILNAFDNFTQDSQTKEYLKNQERSQSLIESSERLTQRKKTISEYTPGEVSPTTGGEFYKSLKQGLIRDVPRGFFGSIEAITAGDGSMHNVNQWAASMADKFLADRMLHPEENAPKDLKAFTEGGYKDIRFWKRGVGQVLSTAIPALAASIAVGLTTKNPALAGNVGRSFIFSGESGQAYNQLIDSGVAPSDAQNGALIYGAIATALENVNFGKTMDKIVGTTKTELVRETFKKSLLQTIKEVGIDTLKEATTEGLQQFAQNAMTKWYNSNQDLFDGVAESVALGGFGGLGFSAMNVSTDVLNQYRSSPSKARDTVRGKIKANEDAKAAAEVELARYENKAKKTVSVRTPENVEVAKIDTVKYDDGKVSSSVTVIDNNKNSTALPFDGEYSSTPEAVKAAAEQAKAIIEQSPNNYSPEAVAAVEQTATAPKEATQGVAPTDLAKEQEKQRREKYGIPEDISTYRGVSQGEWENIQKTGEIKSAEGFSKEADVSWIHADRNYANDFAQQSDGVVIEFKPAARAKMSTESGTEGDQMFLGRGLKIEDIARVTDSSGNIIYEAESGKGKEQQDITVSSQISEGPYKGQFQATITEGENKGKFAIGKTEEIANAKLQEVIAGKEATREPSKGGETKKMTERERMKEFTRIANETNGSKEAKAQKEKDRLAIEAIEQKNKKQLTLADKKEKLTDAEIDNATKEDVALALKEIGNDFFRGVDNVYKSDVRKAMNGEPFELKDGKTALKQHRNYWIERIKNDAIATEKYNERMKALYGDKTIETLERIYDGMTRQIEELQAAGEGEINGMGGRSTRKAVSNEGARQVGEEKMNLGYYIQERKNAKTDDELLDELFPKGKETTVSKEYKKYIESDEGKREIALTKEAISKKGKETTVSVPQKVIDSAKGYDNAEQFFWDKLGDKEPTFENLKKLGFSDIQIKNNTYSWGISWEDLFLEAKIGKPNKNSEKLRKVADTLRTKSEEALSKNRNDNTARRARMADSARDSARADLEFANTLTKLADAIDNGEVKYLNNIGSKADLQRLETVYRIAENKTSRELKKAERDLTTDEIAKYVEADKIRTYLSSSDVSKITPSTYGKATREGVDLKGFLKAAQGNWVSISKWEKEIEYTIKNAESILGSNSYAVRNMKDDLTTYRALEKIKGSASFADMFAELKTIKEGSKVVESPAEILKRKERDLVQRTKIEGFFPTPEKTVERMIEEAGIKKGVTVLEPSAGIGSIADKIREAGVEPDVGEIAPSLSKHLEDKGYNVVTNDFMDFPKSKKYDVIIMNPPFEKLQDVDHVMKAYEHLNAGGRIVSIMGESAFFNSSKKAVDFREWLDKVGGYSEKLPDGTFKDSLRSTGVATRMVFIDKPEISAQKEDGAFAYEIPEKISELNVAKTSAELTERIEQLNKFAMSRGIMRKIGGVSKKTSAGEFYRNGVGKVTTVGEVRIRKDVPLDDKAYMSVLAHELGHSLEYQVLGTINKDTMSIFGKDLPRNTKQEFRAELIANTKEMVGEAEYAVRSQYYSKDAELLARFLERHFTEPIALEKIAPKASEAFIQSAVNNPIISEFLEAANGTIDKMQLRFPGFLNFLLDQRQTFQRLLGERAGNRAYNTIIRRNALQARSKSVFERELNNKFKQIKNTEGVFQAIEAILRTEGGNPIFGTHDFVNVPESEMTEYKKAGFIFVKDENGEPIVDERGNTRMSIDRYTEEEGRKIFDSLSPIEKEFVKDFTAIKDEAKDFINREVIKDSYNIESQVEGWIHHFWEDSFFGTGKTRFKNKTASAQKHRAGVQGYVEDTKKALYKALTELEGAKIFNEWLREFIPSVTKPLADGQSPDVGWMEVTGDFMRGFVKEGDIKEYLITDAGRFKVNRTRYQIPIEIYNRFGKIAEFTQEAGSAYGALELIAKAWQVNVLAHPGTAMTNAIGGGLQFSLKMFTDMYKSILTGDPSAIGQDFSALIGSLTNWNDVPSWMFGNDSSTFMRDQGNKKYSGKMRIMHAGFDRFANVVMAPFQFFESYWKKVIARASGARGISELDKLTKDGLPPLSDSDKVVLDMIEQASDMYGFNYNNVPNWMREMSTNPIGKLTLPFKRYLYKYMKMLSNHLLSTVNRNMSWQDRLSRFMGLATFIGVIAAIINANDDDKETPEDITSNTPKWMSPKGKMFAGKDENGLEKFIRTVKYPGFNLFAFTKGDVVQGFGDISEGASSVGPLGQLILHQVGYKNPFETYKETSQLHAATAASFVPGFRILGDISQILDPFRRKPEDWKQEFTRLIPTTNPEEQEKLHGKIYVDKVPTGKNSTKDVQRVNYWQDTATSLLTGIYTTRINPASVKAFEKRFGENEIKKQTKETRDAENADFVERYMQKFKEATDKFPSSRIRRELQDEIRGDSPKLTEEMKTRTTLLFKKIQEELAGENDPTVQEINTMNSLEDKKTILLNKRTEMLSSGQSAEDFRSYLADLKKKGIVSDELWKKIFISLK